MITPITSPAVRLFVGGHASRVCGEVQDLAGDRCFSVAHPAQVVSYTAGLPVGLLDSGAFTDVKRDKLLPTAARRRTPAEALARQLAGEVHASEKWGTSWQTQALASYDRLIDEMWLPGQGQIKRRWSQRQAERAVGETVEAAAYLHSQRARIAPRILVQGVQGVDASQYSECVTAVLPYTQPGDWVGLGGWCILGMWQRWLPQFWAAMHLSLPQIAAAGVSHVHIYGMTWLPALGGLVWLADQYGISVSADSSRPILNCTWKDPKRAGVKAGVRPDGSVDWRANVRWWVDTLASLRTSKYYQPPPALRPAQLLRQLSLLEDVA